MLRYIFAFLGIAIAWALCLLLELSIWIATGLTAAVLVTLIVLYVLGRRRANRAANQLEAALSGGAQQQGGVRPDLQAEMMEIEREFKEAISALKQSKVRGGGNALYEMPWFAIIGPPGAGKSTALRNSGLQFPHLSKSGGGVRGIGGTRNCDWWLTNEAVLLDTAGRWSTEAEDRDEWLGFLDMLRSFRSKHPLNGLIVAVPATDLGHAQENQVQWLAQQIRERIDEVMNRLEMALPVYVLFTKCDLLPGFVETFEDMDRESRGQLWGFTAPLTQPVGEPGQFFDTRFSTLLSQLYKRRLRRLAEARRYDQREKIFAFPQQFECLKTNLSHFVSLVFLENVYQETPMMRGIYFSSGTQEGRPIDMVMQRMASAFGVQPQGNVAGPAVAQKSYFLRDVFQQVLFKDRDISVRSPEEQKRLKRNRLLLSGGIFLLATLILALPTVSWYENKALVEDTEALVQSVAHNWRTTTALPPSTLEPLRQEVSMLQESRPFSMGFGMYQGSRILGPLNQLYGKLYHRCVLRPLVSHEETELSTFATGFPAGMPDAVPTPEQRQTRYEQLKRYLLLTSPQVESAPAIEGELETWLIASLSRIWEGTLTVPSGEAGQQTRDAVRANTSTFIALLNTTPELGIPRNDSVVSNTRSAIARVPFEAVGLYRIEREQSGRNYDLNLLTILRNPAASVSNRRTIRGAYTRGAYESRVRNRLDDAPSTFIGDPWVLGTDTSPNTAHDSQLTERLQSAYYRQYMDEWRNFIEGMRVATPSGSANTALEIQELTTGRPPPLGRFWSRLAFEVLLIDPRANAQAGAQAGAASLGQRLTTRLRSSTAGRALVAGASAEANSGTGEAPGLGSIINARDVQTAFANFISYGVPPRSGSSSAPQTTNLDLWHEDLDRVRQALVQQSGYRTPLRTARNRVNGQISNMDQQWRQALTNLLLPPLSGVN